jgi:arylsulfatase A-like enzyme
MMPLAEGRSDVKWRNDWLYEYYEYPGFENVRPCRGVRTKRYKLIDFFLEPEEFEVYDLEADPDEAHNLYGKPGYEELTAHLKARLAALRAETGELRVQADGIAAASGDAGVVAAEVKRQLLASSY